MTGVAGTADWAARVESGLRAVGGTLVDRAIAVEDSSSTQDLALERCEGRPGLVVVASRQSGGRGRLGRTWLHQGDLGLAATFVLPGTLRADRLSVAAGLGAAIALDGFAGGAAPLGVRWPNDVVEAEPRPGGGRKLAGVLVEQRGGVSLLGIGVNVNQREQDWPEELRGRVASLAEIGRGGAVVDRVQVACALAAGLSLALVMPLTELIPAWLRRDVLKGSEQAFLHQGRTVRGVVESLEPTGEIVVRCAGGERVRLPALTTSLLK